MKMFLLVLLTPCFLFFPRAVSAQNQRVALDCYTSYKKKGDNYVSLGNYDLAIQQYQAAKYCNNITAQQKKELDSLIAQVNKMRQLPMKKTVIIKRY
jgi:hypothetical protein